MKIFLQLLSIGILCLNLISCGPDQNVKQKNEQEKKMKDLKTLVLPFYTKCLTVNQGVDPTEILETLLSNDFQSLNSTEKKDKSTLMNQIQFFWKMIPDLKWEPQEIIQADNQVIVRSIATGSPKGDFMGLKLDGSKSFKIMSIDIHTIVDDKIKTVYHIEEWVTAIKQLK